MSKWYSCWGNECIKLVFALIICVLYLPWLLWMGLFLYNELVNLVLISISVPKLIEGEASFSFSSILALNLWISKSTVAKLSLLPLTAPDRILIILGSLLGLLVCGRWCYRTWYGCFMLPLTSSFTGLLFWILWALYYCCWLRPVLVLWTWAERQRCLVL
jgi:hypothetical protein